MKLKDCPSEWLQFLRAKVFPGEPKAPATKAWLVSKFPQAAGLMGGSAEQTIRRSVDLQKDYDRAAKQLLHGRVL